MKVPVGAPDKGPSFWQRLGGRKNANGYLYAILISAAALKLDASFEAYAMWLAVALLGTSAIVAVEDSIGKHKAGKP